MSSILGRVHGEVAERRPLPARAVVALRKCRTRVFGGDEHVLDKLRRVKSPAVGLLVRDEIPAVVHLTEEDFMLMTRFPVHLDVEMVEFELAVPHCMSEKRPFGALDVHFKEVDGPAFVSQLCHNLLEGEGWEGTFGRFYLDPPFMEADIERFEGIQRSIEPRFSARRIKYVNLSRW